MFVLIFVCVEVEVMDMLVVYGYVCYGMVSLVVF